MASERNIVVGVFRERERARDAIEALKDANFTSDEISVLMPDRSDTQTLAAETGTAAGTGFATGALAGGLLGGVGGWLVGIGALAVPGVGPFIAAGAIATALTGAAVGASVGAVTGALIGLGVPEEEAGYYEQEVKGGRTLVTVRANGRYAEARALLRRYGAYDIQARDTEGATYEGATTGSPLTATDPMATPALSPAATAYASTAPDVPTTPPRYQASDPMRRPTVTSSSIDTAPDSRGSDTLPAYYTTVAGQWADELVRHRSRWEGERTADESWDRYEPLYRYGWEQAHAPRYLGRAWSDVEHDLQRDWERRYPDRAWREAARYVREAWEQSVGATTHR